MAEIQYMHRDLTKAHTGFQIHTGQSSIGTYSYNVVTKEFSLSPVYLAIHELDNKFDTISDFLQSLHPEDRDSTARTIGELMKKLEAEAEISELETCYRIVGRRTGMVKIIRDIMTPQFDRGQLVGIWGVIQDITDEFERSQALKKLTEELESAKRALDESQKQAFMGSWEMDCKTYAQTWSEGQLNLYEVSRDEAPSNFEEFLAFAHEDDREILVEVMNRLTTLASHLDATNFHFRIRAKRSGKTKIIKARIRCQYENGVLSKLIGTNQDVTEEYSKRSELQDLTIKLELFNRTLEDGELMAGMGSWVFEVQSETITMSKGFTKIYEFDEVDSISVNEFFDAVHQEDRPTLVNWLVKLKSSSIAEIPDLTFRIVGRKTGRVKFLRSRMRLHEEDGVIVRVVGVNVDMTESVIQQQELERTNQLLIESQDLAALGGWEMDLETNAFLWNSGELKHYEIDSPPANIEEYLRLVHPDDHRIIFDALNVDQYTHEGVQRKDRFRIVTPTGEAKVMLSTVVPVFENNRLKKLRGVTQDISEISRATDDILYMNARLHESQRLAKMGSWESDILNGRAHLSESLLEIYEAGTDTRLINSFEDFLEFVVVEDREKVRTNLANLKAGHQGNLDYTMRIVGARTGKEKVLRTIVRPVYVDGELVSILGSQMDVTESSELLEMLGEFMTDLKETQHIAGVGSWRYDVQGASLTWSEEMSVMLEVDPDSEQSAATYINCIHPDDRDRSVEEFRQLEDFFQKNPNEFCFGELRMVGQRTGKVRYFKGATKAIWVDDKIAEFKGVMRDVSREVEQRREIERLYQALSESQKLSDTGSYQLLWESGVLELSEGLQQIMETKSRHLKVEQIVEFVHPDDTHLVNKNLSNFQNRSAEPTNSGFRILTRSGRTKYLDVISRPLIVDGNVVGRQGVAVDITRFVEYEKQLNESKRQLELTYDVMLQGIIHYDSEGSILKLNPAAERILGPRNSQGLFSYQLFLPDGTDVGDSLCEYVHVAGSATLGSELRIVSTTDGVEKWVKVDSFPSTEADERFCVINDITDARHSFDLLMNSEKRFSNVFNYSGVGMAIISTSGRFENVNERLCAITGYPAEELYTKRLDEITHVHDLEEELRNLEGLLRGERTSFTYEKRILGRDGNIRWVSQTTSSVQDSDGQPLYLLAQFSDITDRLLAERAVQEYQQKFITAFHQSSVGMLIADAKGKIVEVNQAVCYFLGYDKEELLHFDILDLLIPKPGRDGQKSIADMNGHTLEMDFRRGSGELLHALVTTNDMIDPELDATSYIMQLQDVTEAVRNQLELEQTHKRFEHIFKFGGIGMGMSDGHGRLIEVNESLCQITGYSENELLGMRFADLTHPDDQDENTKLFRSVITGKVDSFTLEQRYVHKSGKVLNVIITASKLSSVQMDDNLILGQIQDVTEIRREELANRENEEKFKLLVENSLVGVGMTEVETIVYANPTLLKMFGYGKSPQEFLGKKLRDMATANTKKVVAERIERTLAGEKVPEVFQGQFYTKQGNIITIEVQARSIRLGEKQYRMAVISDVTEKLVYQKSLEDTNIIMQLALKFADLGTWRWTIATGELYWSDSIYKLFGYKKGRDSVSYANFLKAVHPEDQQKVISSIEVCLESNKPYEIEHRILLNDGSVRWVIEKGNVVRNARGIATDMYGVVREITDSKRKDEELVRSKELYQLLAESGEELICLHSLDGHFLYASPALKSLLGYDPGCLPKTLRSVDLVHPDDQAVFTNILENVVKTKGEEMIDQIRFRHKNGNYVWCEKSVRAVLNASGEVESLRSLTRNIEARLIYRQQLENSNEQLEAALTNLREAADAKENFMSIMSHEIRTPLNSVIGLSNLLLRRTPRADQVEVVETLKGAADNLMNLVNDILDYNKIRAGKLQMEMRPFNFYEFLKQHNNSFKISALDKGLGFKIKADTRIPEVVVGDTTRLNQIIANLLTNAIKFTHTGFVKLSVDLLESNNKRCVLDFKIEDTGVGIAEEKLDSIFQPFHQSDPYISRQYGGTGLGLSIVKSLTELMGGSVSVKSKVAQGTVFDIVLPFLLSEVDLDIPEREARTHSHRLVMHSMEKKLNVLYVEDVQSNRFLVEGLLSDNKINCTSVDSGKAALKLTNKTKFDVILMDIQMPEMDGYQTTVKIRSQRGGKNNTTPVIAFTAESFSTELKKKSLTHDIQYLITKPFEPEKLIEKILWLAQFNESPSARFFSLKFYEEYFGKEPRKFSRIKKAIRTDLGRFVRKTKQFDKKHSLTGIQEEAHRIRPILKNLRAVSIVIGVDRFKAFEEYTPEVGTLLEEVHLMIDKLIAELK